MRVLVVENDLQTQSSTFDSTGIAGLDAILSGGYQRGSMVVIAGATGIGKTHLGLHWLAAAARGPSIGGAIVDLSSRGDGQNHAAYAQRLAHQSLDLVAGDGISLDPASWLESQDRYPQLLQLWGYDGRPQVRSWLGMEDEEAFQVDWNRLVERLSAFCYANLLRGRSRWVIDGIEPSDDPASSLQHRVIEHLYHRILRRDHDWLAREVLRQQFRAHQTQVETHRYDTAATTAMLLVTTRETMIDDLIAKPLAEGDLAAGAATLIYVGRVRDGMRIRRAIYVAKHRGGKLDDAIHPFEINDQGIAIDAS
jgi:KaiC/GvpD/RAD55 family RecA-like ATPase